MADAFNKEAFTLLGVGTFVIGVRMYARFKAVKSIGSLAADDYLMLLAAVSEQDLGRLVCIHVLRRLQLTFLSYR